jgi:hypothetical protein
MQREGSVRAIRSASQHPTSSSRGSPSRLRRLSRCPNLPLRHPIDRPSL